MSTAAILTVTYAVGWLASMIYLNVKVPPKYQTPDYVVAGSFLCACWPISVIVYVIEKTVVKIKAKKNKDDDDYFDDLPYGVG